MLRKRISVVLLASLVAGAVGPSALDAWGGAWGARGLDAAGVAAAQPVPRTRAVYLNGVKLDERTQLKNQTFSNADIRFDEQGDLWITVKGVKVTVQTVDVSSPPPASPGAPLPPVATPPPTTPGAPATPQPTPARKYWLVSSQPRRGFAQYDVEVHINGAFVKKVRCEEPQTLLDVSAHVRPGVNQVRLVATKIGGGKRTSTSPADTLDLVIGEGEVGAGQVRIDRPVVQWRRTAAETANVSEDFQFTVR